MPNFSKPDAEDSFFYLLAAALFACVANDLAAGVWYVHSGDYFPWRHPPGIWLYPPSVLLMEWIFTALAALCLIGKPWRYAGVLIGSGAMLASLLQRFSNQRSLLFIILLYLTIAPRSGQPAGPRVFSRAFPAIRFQLLIVYLFSVVNKIDSGFWDGRTLAQLAQESHAALLPGWLVLFLIGGAMAVPLSLFTLGMEFSLPLVLMRWPRLGFSLVVILHSAFCLFMPGLWPFALAMMAMAVLFQREKSSSH